jgi:hypothetical protein
LLLCIALVSGCKKEEITVYRVPKEQPKPALAATPSATAARPRLRWPPLPAGWREEAPTSLRAASFSVRDGADQYADMAVIALNGLGGPDVEFVNLWRQQLGLKPVSDADLAGKVEPVTIAGSAAKLFDIAAETPSEQADQPDRILVAVLARSGTSWFFKLQGDEPLVGRQKAAFVEFLKTVSFIDPPATEAGTAAPAGAGEANPHWEVPAGWQEVPPTRMLRAKYVVAAADANARAEVNVSSFPGEVGGLLANVNRWRGQVGLPPVSEAEVDQAAAPLDVPGGKAMLVDVTGTDSKSGQATRLIGAIVPRPGHTWFYVLRGPEALAAREKPAFIRFVQSVRYPNA